MNRKQKQELARLEKQILKTAHYIECTRILAEEAANVYIMDMPSYTALNRDFTGYAFYPLYVQDFAKLHVR